MSLKDARLLLVGCGHMGSALVRGWLSQDILEGGIDIVTPHEASVSDFAHDARIHWHSNPDEVKSAPDIIVFATKPSLLESILPLYRRFINHKTVFVSVAAGKPLSFYAQHLGKDALMIRTMPNTPSAIAKGVTLACAGLHVSKEQKALVDALLQAIGRVFWIEDEDQIDLASALSSCGPAYLFQFVESLASAAEKLGLPGALAMELAKETVIGSSAYLEATNRRATELRNEVASPGGMTEAALKILTNDNVLETLLIEALDAATKRAKER